MSKFWDRVLKCPHTDEMLSSNYFDPIYCATPYCDGDVVHCLNCGVFISKCRCGYNSGMSGWPPSRWHKLWSP